jgi:hypothetical protein
VEDSLPQEMVTYYINEYIILEIINNEELIWPLKPELKKTL